MKSTFSSLREESPIGNGWILRSGVLCIEWEDEDVAQNLRTQKEILLVKCCCRKKRCVKSTNCKCHKNVFSCGPLCRCVSCSNNNKMNWKKKTTRTLMKVMIVQKTKKTRKYWRMLMKIVTFMNLKLKITTEMLGSWICLLNHKYSCMNISIKQINENSMSARNTE